MDEINKYRKLKLKRILLSEIILKNKLKSDTDSYNIKTERPNIKSRDKSLYLNYNYSLIFEQHFNFFFENKNRILLL